MSDQQVDDLVVGRGRLFFNQFVNGTTTPTAEKFFGNVPSVQLAQQNTQLDHYASTSGLKVKDRTVTLQNDHTITFASDNMDVANLALWFLGVQQTETTASATPVTQDWPAVLGAYFQMGVDANNPQGLRNVTAVTVVKGSAPGTPITAAGNYEIDLAGGRIYFESDAPDIEAGDILTIGWTAGTGSQILVIDQGIQIFGQLRFMSDNPVGSNKDYFWPYVQLSASGNLDLIADTWQQATFAASVLKLGSQPRYVVTQR
jgi:hypothetical protein